MGPPIAELLTPEAPCAAFTIIIPLLAALAAVPLGDKARRLAFPVGIAGLVVAALTTAQIVINGPIEHAIGGWDAPLGIRLRVDGLAAGFLLTTAIVTTGVALFSREMYRANDGAVARAAYAFWPQLFLMWAALNAVFVSADLFNLYVALELLTLTAVAMVALDGKAEMLAAAIRYLLFALFGSLAYLLGVALLYSAFGTLDMQLLRETMTAELDVLLAGALMTAGLMAKSAIFPLHAWLPPAHGGATPPVSAMLSSVVTKASFYLIARLWFDVMPIMATENFVQLLGALGVGGILIGAFMAFRQNRLKLIIAYSTVSQLGYLLLIFPLAGGGGETQPWSAPAWTGGIFHALAHAPAKAAMFLAAGVFVQAVGHDRLSGLIGIAKHLPMAAFAFALAAVSLMGLPPSGGFTAKYLLLTSAFASGQWWWAAAILAGGLLAAGYLFRVLNRFLSESETQARLKPVARSSQAIALMLAGLSILLGLASLPPYDLLQIGRTPEAAEGLS